MTIVNVIIVAALIMLAVLGHSLWHGAEVAVLNFITQVFTGAHVTG